MATFLLIHGAWHGGWCWERVADDLAARGHAVHAPDLPGHGDDPADPAGVTMADYVARVTERLRALPEPAILVGHSMGGMAISAAAEVEPERVRTLIYLAAFVPRDGESLMDIAARDPRAAVPPHIVPDEAGATLGLAPGKAQGLFYGEVAEPERHAAEARLTPQPAAPFGTPVRLGEGFARTPKHYVACTRDDATAIELQRALIAATPGITAHEIASDHSPFLSHPEALADLLHRIAAGA